MLTGVLLAITNCEHFLGSHESQTCIHTIKMLELGLPILDRITV